MFKIFRVVVCPFSFSEYTKRNDSSILPLSQLWPETTNLQVLDLWSMRIFFRMNACKIAYNSKQNTRFGRVYMYRPCFMVNLKFPADDRSTNGVHSSRVFSAPSNKNGAVSEPNAPHFSLRWPPLIAQLINLHERLDNKVASH